MGIHTKQSLIENSAEDDCTAASPTYPPISRIIPRRADPMPFPICSQSCRRCLPVLCTVSGFPLAIINGVRNHCPDCRSSAGISNSTDHTGKLRSPAWCFRQIPEPAFQQLTESDPEREYISFPNFFTSPAIKNIAAI